MVRTLKKSVLIKVCQENKFIAARWKDGYAFGVNCRILNIKTVQDRIKNSKSEFSNIISWRPISFQEYITRKIGLCQDPTRKLHL